MDLVLETVVDSWVRGPPFLLGAGVLWDLLHFLDGFRRRKKKYFHPDVISC
jgi:hypothetical protein